MRRRLRAVAAALPLLVAGAWLPAAASEVPAASGAAGRGHLLLCGGAGMPAAYWPKLFELAGGITAPIVVLPTASERPEAGSEVEEELRALGATAARWLPLRTAPDAARPELVAAIAAARAVFFTGGDQNRITAALAGTPAEAAVRAVFERGGVLAGTSAGTACMSDPMITGDGDFTVLRAGSAALARGLGFFPGAIVDQHFVARQRHNRLLVATLEHPDLLGVGVDERTAIWVGPDGVLEVLGEGWVEIFDARAAHRRTLAGPQGARHAARDVTLHLLVEGDRFDLAAGRPLAGTAPAP